MKLVIEIPENTYHQIQALASNGYFEHDICGNSMRRIANGTPLPKGHGRLKDADKVEQLLDLEKPDNAIAKALKSIMDSVPTIIEADKAESEE